MTAQFTTYFPDSQNTHMNSETTLYWAERSSLLKKPNANEKSEKAGKTINLIHK